MQAIPGWIFVFFCLKIFLCIFFDYRVLYFSYVSKTDVTSNQTINELYGVGIMLHSHVLHFHCFTLQLVLLEKRKEFTISNGKIKFIWKHYAI